MNVPLCAAVAVAAFAPLLVPPVGPGAAVPAGGVAGRWPGPTCATAGGAARRWRRR